MKKILIAVLVAVSGTSMAFAGEQLIKAEKVDINFADSGSRAVNQAVISRIDQIPVYNEQSQALTMGNVCRILGNREVDLGKTSSVRCFDKGNGVIELIASDSRTMRSRSILANANDKTVIEYRGTDYVYYYLNNFGQQITINMAFVSSGVSNNGYGAYVHGSYRADIFMSDMNGRSRFGYYSNLNY